MEPGSVLRQALVRGWCEFENRDKTTDRELLRTLPSDFVIDVMLRFRDFGGDEGEDGFLRVCDYHGHSNGVE